MWTTRSTLASIIILGLLWRIVVAIWVYPTFRPGGPTGGDANAYVTLAENLLSGHGYSIDSAPPYEPYAYRPPAYPIFLAGALYLGGGSHAAAVVAQILLDIATALVLFQLARRVWPERRSLHTLVLALWATCPAVGSFAGRLLAEVLATFLVSCATLLLIEAALGVRRRSLFFGIGSGMTFMASVLARTQLALTALALPVLIASTLPRPVGQGGGSRRVGLLIAVFIGMLLVELPWVARNLVTLDSPVLLARGQAEQAFAMGLVERKRVETAAEVNERLAAIGMAKDEVTGGRDVLPAIELVRRDPTGLLVRSIKRAVLLWASPRTSIYGITPTEIRHALVKPLVPSSLIVLIVSGLMTLYYTALLTLSAAGALRYARHPVISSLILASPVAITLVAMWFHLESRYVLPAFPAVVLAAALALDDLLARSPALQRRGRALFAGLRVRFGGALKQRRRGLVPLIIVVLTVAHALVLSLVFNPYLDNQPVNQYSSQRGDAYDYIERAQILANSGSFSDAFRDRYRMPGYPLFLSIFFRMTEEPLRVARIAQVLLSSLVLPLSYVVLRCGGLGIIPALCSCAMFGLWPPIYYFAPILLPESLSITLIAALLATLSIASIRATFVAVLGVAALVAFLTYLKPNHLLMLLPCLAFLGCLGVPRPKRLVVSAGIVALLMVAIAPWFMFLSTETATLMPLTNAQGKNLLQGTGAAVEPISDALHDRVARALSLYDPQAQAIYEGTGDQRQLAGIQEDMGFRIWRARPVATALYGLAKCGHTLGFSLRDPRDVLNAFLSMASFASAILLVSRRQPRIRPWVAYYFTTLAVVLGQAFLFLPNQRFKVVTFDFPAMIIAALAIHGFWSQLANAFRRSASPTPG
jgi:hypothetical protein